MSDADCTEITREELLSLLLNTSGASIVTLTYTTGPSSRMRKTKPTTNPWWDKPNKRWTIEKTSRVQGMVGASYKNAVNNQLLREAEEAGLSPDEVEEFEPQERYWGSRIEGTPLVQHVKDGETRYYLEILKFRTLDFGWFDEEGEVDEDDVDPFIRERSQPDSQPTEKEIRLRDIRLDHIDRISINGEKFEIIH